MNDRADTAFASHTVQVRPPLRLRHGGSRGKLLTWMTKSAPRRFGQLLRLCVVLVSLALPLSCAGLDKAPVVHAVVEFHARFNAEDWSAIYSDADAAFRAATSQDVFTRAMRTLKSRVGRFESSVETYYGVQGQAGVSEGTYVRVQYSTKFSQQPATETFAWRIDNGKVKLFSYDAQ